MTQVFNGPDWISATGRAYAGRGVGSFRPTQAYKVAKAKRPAKSAPSVALARELRRTALRIAKATAPFDLPGRAKPKPRARTTTLSMSEYASAVPLERWRSDRVLQRLRYQPDR